MRDYFMINTRLSYVFNDSTHTKTEVHVRQRPLMSLLSTFLCRLL
jgi:hypothetical protein